MTRAKAMIKMDRYVSEFLAGVDTNARFTAATVSQYVNLCDRRFNCMAMTAGILLRRRDDVDYDDGIWRKRIS